MDMDGENNGSKPYEQMDDLGGNIPLFLETARSRWWQLKHFLFLPRNPGEDEPILTSIFFKWVETTNQIKVRVEESCWNNLQVKI